MFITLIVILLIGNILTLYRHIKLKRQLYILKQDMKKHMLENGFDNSLWVMFTERTRKMLRFWQ
ncbi:hypothetical protein C0W27_15725 [Photobacterium angustum]|uniref:Uncharacterized protein n=1 Tax=Photobacterium angustum TaxID=661 RepID=A0ABX5H1K7_PHOAN|nr:hypothetical protein C0W27_15725 [Photobacterium angustum]